MANRSSGIDWNAMEKQRLEVHLTCAHKTDGFYKWHYHVPNLEEPTGKGWYLNEGWSVSSHFCTAPVGYPLPTIGDLRLQWGDD
jgi:hypothetical protein